MDEMKIMVGSSGHHEFTVIERDNCVLVRGALSASGMRGVTAMRHKKAVISPDLARMLDVNFAFGLQADIDALIAKITPQHQAAAKRTAAARGLSEAAAIWLACGQRGNSSETIFTHLTGVNANTGTARSHPYYPADVRRCWLLLEDVPELKAKFHRMAEVSQAWVGLVSNWSQIIATMTEEVGDIRNPKRGAEAPRTYKLIKQAIGR